MHVLLFKQSYAYIYVDIDIDIDIDMHIYIYINMYVYVYRHTHVHALNACTCSSLMHVGVYVCIRARTCLSIYAFANIYLCSACDSGVAHHGLYKPEAHI